MPVTNKFDTLGPVLLQKLWLPFPEGGGVVVTVSVGWSVKLAVVQPVTVVATTLYVVFVIGTLAWSIVKLRLLPVPVPATGGLSETPAVVFSS